MTAELLTVMPLQYFPGYLVPAPAQLPLLQTWTLAVEVLPEHAVDSWHSATEQLKLTMPGFEEHVTGLDQYLDEVEILLDELATEHGLETSTSI